MPEMLQNPARSVMPSTHSQPGMASSPGSGAAPVAVTATTPEKGAKSRTQTVIRGRLDEDSSPRPPAITLPPPEALGLIPPRTPIRGQNANNSVQHDPCANGGNCATADSHFSSDRRGILAPNATSPTALDWSGLRRNCEQLGISAYRLEKLETGQWRFACVLPARSGQTQREVEAIADSETAAVSAVLQHLTQNSASQ